MLDVKCFVHHTFTSNTYLLVHKGFPEDAYLVDVGNSQAVLDALNPNQKIKAVFLTHAHYDHIYGINEIISKFPECVIYCSEYAKQGLYSEKLNLSFYHENPVVLKNGEISIVADGALVDMNPLCRIEVLETKGHNEGSICFKIHTGIFTGDSLIPEVPVVTKLKSGNKEEAIKSVIKIRQSSTPNDKIYPGHGMVCNASEINWDLYLS